MVLGYDVGPEEACRLVVYGAVDRLEYSYLSSGSFLDWLEKQLTPFLGYTPEILHLTKVWMGFVCKSLEDVSLLLCLTWVNEGSILMLKRWRVGFDPVTEHFQFHLLWVLMPGLPIHMWNEGALMDIGELLRKFIAVDTTVMKNSSRKMARVLVEMDIHGRLPEVLDIEWRDRHYTQKLDFLGISFCCCICHCIGHLPCECIGKIMEEDFEDSQLQI